MVELNFNAEDVEPTSSFDAIPAGEYPVIVTESDMVKTKDGRGSYLRLTLEILDGKFKGRKLWDNLNLENVNVQTVEIARQQLSALCHATGRINVRDSQELHNMPIIAKVKLVPPKGKYEAQNQIATYKKASEGATENTPAPMPETAKAGDDDKTWEY